MDKEKGNPMSDLKWLVIIVLAVWFIGRFAGMGGQATDKDKSATTKSFFSKTESQAPETSTVKDNNSKWKGMVRIGRGNGSGEFQPNQEYVTLRAESGNKEPINITGWSLENGKNKKFFPVNDTQRRGVSNKVVLSKATQIFIPNGVNLQGDIILEPGGRAIITTGKVASGIPFEIKTNFRENICAGYIEELSSYDFTPSLRTDCPSAQDEAGVDSLDEGCYKFVSRMSSCHTPEFKDVVYKNKEPLTGFVDNVGNLSYSCKNFLKAHYNYESCVINHLSDKNFFGKDWRIFLNYPYELWAKDRETITLYDSEGKVVDELTYGY